jgi:hypothetical protein
LTEVLWAARLSLRRLRSPAVPVAGAAALGVATVAWIAGLERAEAPSRAADYTLFGVVFGWAVPLLAYVATGRALRSARLDRALGAVVRAGGDRRRAALGLLAGTALATALASALLAVVGVLVARGRLDGEALADASTSAAIAALGGVAYVAWFGLGSLFGGSGGGRAVCLGIDWVLGTGHTFAAVAWPRAHLGNLIGGQAVLGFSQGESAAALYLLAAAYLAVTLVWLRR